MERERKPEFFEALLPVLITAVLLFTGIVFLGIDPHIPLVLGTIVASILGAKLGFSWEEIKDGLLDGINIAMSSVIILLIIGIVIGVWILSGTVPTMIYYGMKLLSPKIFLVATALICAVVSVSSGSSWTTAGTVGIALIGVGEGLGIPLPMVAGAIISGAYFGDKMSPLSDTTNLAPAMAGSELFEHIKHMIYTTAPAFIISLILFWILGRNFGAESLDAEKIDLILNTLNQTFTINIWMLIPAVVVFTMAAMKLPAIPTLISGSVIGGVFAMLFQGVGFSAVINAMHYGYSSETGVEVLDSLLSRGGLNSMMWTISLILCALAFGGVLDKVSVLEVIVNKILSFADTTGKLIASNIISCIGANALLGDQFLSIIVPGRMYRAAYEKKGLHPKNLSRVLEDSGTLTAVLIPWTAGGAYMASTLGVDTIAYLPYCFFNLLVPVVSMVYGFMDITIEPSEASESASNAQTSETIT
ncbi:Na+/H+ antiporter NhaC [Acetohalobium arabaticum]|uniref:Sodium/proton antiporter, NhaC family (TC 2.A.35.1.1) n=1 Tax=Acetohalobium arabaticum (strain ATCC 49924 / DSM 5501 / Z-7288) TaxID=574087 RepID=D9QQ35_ACEAZ|nr:Na+/H+ antiporter NhaC [Acetohalobium arabaticum]ADL12626.1 sodium/proton antiporter, NhaC family (TC 2.A.35.1.1) [Acetohalobium arabaticum DSM 5501]